MRIFEGGPGRLISKVLGSDTAKTVGQIGKETIVVMAVLASLAVVHYGIRYSGAGPEFQGLFNAFHQACILAAYVFLAAKFLLKLLKM